MSSSSPAGASACDLDQLLRLAAPVQDADLSTHAMRQAISSMARSVVSEPRAATAAAPPTASFQRPQPARRRRTVAGISLASAVWALSATGVAAAGGYALYSGFVDSPSSTESVQGEQYVNVGSPQFEDAYARITTSYPLPTGKSYAPLYDAVVATGGLKQLTGAAGEVAMYSGCAWAGAWVQSHDAGDTAAEQTAVAGLERTARSSDLAYIDGGGLVARAAALVDAATAGEAAPIAAYAASSDCTAASR